MLFPFLLSCSVVLLHHLISDTLLLLHLELLPCLLLLSLVFHLIFADSSLILELILLLVSARALIRVKAIIPTALAIAARVHVNIFLLLFLGTLRLVLMLLSQLFDFLL